MKQDRIDSIARALAHHVSTGAVRGADRFGDKHWMVDLHGGGLQRSITNEEAEVLCAGLAAATRRPMAEQTARLIRSMHSDCVEGGINGGWTDADLPLILEAYRVTGATVHELWDMHLIPESEHDEQTCTDPYCEASRRLHPILFECENCGWEWPGAKPPPDGAVHVSCGGPLVSVEPLR